MDLDLARGREIEKHHRPQKNFLGKPVPHAGQSDTSTSNLNFAKATRHVSSVERREPRTRGCEPQREPQRAPPLPLDPHSNTHTADARKLDSHRSYTSSTRTIRQKQQPTTTTTTAAAAAAAAATVTTTTAATATTHQQQHRQRVVISHSSSSF